MNDELVVFDDRQKFVVGLWLRVVAAGVFLLILVPITALKIDFPLAQCFPAYIGLVALIGLNAVYWRAARSRGFPVTDFYVHWALDLILISTVLYGLGGALVPSSITAYILIVITSAVFISQRASFIVATGAALAYGGSIAAEMLNIIDPKYEIGVPTMSSGMTVLVIFGPIAMAYLVAFITGTLGDQLNELNRLLIKKNAELRERHSLLDRMQSELDFQSKVLAHDVRSPVSAAFAAISEFKREVGAQLQDSGLLEIALQNLNRVEDMIDAVQQAREGMDPGENQEPVDIAAVIAELRVELDGRLASAKVHFEVFNDLPTIVAVRNRLVVMFRNLITNAIRYVPGDGTGKIEVGAIEAKEEWRVFVKDNGPGVKAEFQEVIFEMFRKAPQKQRSPGMGLGLALVRQVAVGQGGRAWIESDGQSGATFWVSFPKPMLASADSESAPIPA